MAFVEAGSVRASGGQLCANEGNSEYIMSISLPPQSSIRGIGYLFNSDFDETKM